MKTNTMTTRAKKARQKRKNTVYYTTVEHARGMQVSSRAEIIAKQIETVCIYMYHWSIFIYSQTSTVWVRAHASSSDTSSPLCPKDAPYTLSVQRATTLGLWRAEVKLDACAQLSEAGS